MPEYYLLLKHSHFHIAVLSISLLGLRCLLSFSNFKYAKYVNHKIVRYISYSIDAVLLSLALWLIYILPTGYFYNYWLYIKLGLVLIYIVLGSFALKRGKTLKIKIICFILAFIVLLQIYFIAKLKHPYGIFLYLIY